MIPSLFDKAGAFLKDSSPSTTEKILDPTLIATFLSSVLSFIRGCSSQTTAAERIKEGGPVAMGAALKIVREHTDLKGAARRQKAAELVKTGKDLTPEEMQSLLSDAADIPVETPPTGVWPMAVLLCIFFFGSACQAQEIKGIWPIDVEQNKRLDRLEAAVFSKEAKEPSSPRSLPTNHAPAYQIINGVLHHTSDAHLIEHGYSPEDLVGLTQAQKDALHGAAHAAQPSRALASAKQPVYQTICNGRSCRRVKRFN
jgi:hypothetical protein